MVSKYKNVEYIEADMLDENEIQNLFQEIEDKFGRLDVLVNSVGGKEREGTLEDAELSTWSILLILHFVVTGCVQNTQHRLYQTADV
jgi:NAD(P)-dependent dehydrogenase (short-subunit alcohol dehydrogenase family)